MKTFAKLSLLAFAGLTLVGCGIGAPNNNTSKGGNNPSKGGGWASNAGTPSEYVQPQSSDDGYVEPSSKTEMFPRYDIPDVEIPEEELPGANELPDEWPGYTPADPVIAEPITSYDPYTVICDVVCCSGGYQYDVAMLESYGYIQQKAEDVYIGRSVTYWTADYSDQLDTIINYFVLQSGDFPDYLTYYDANQPRLGTLTSGGACAVALTVTPDGEVGVELLAYVDGNGYTRIQFTAAYLPYFLQD